MRLKTFDAPTMQDAMQRIRAALGEDAIILSATKAANGGVRVTAAIEGHAEEGEDAFQAHSTAKPNIRVVQAAASGPRRVSVAELRRLEGLWGFHGVPEALASRLRHAAHFIQYEDELELLPELLGRLFRFSADNFEAHDTVMLVGPPAMGKTLTAAKIAAQSVLEGRAAQVITTDTKRAGGIEQLRAFTDILDVTLTVVEDAAGLAHALETLPGDRLTVIDNAGTNIFDDEDKRQLGQYITLVGVPPVLVMAAGIDPGESQDIARTFAALGADRMIATRTDTARRFGGVLAAALTGEMALSHYTHSARVAEGLAALDAGTVAALLSGAMISGGDA